MDKKRIYKISNPEYAKAMHEIGRSNAAQPHQSKKRQTEGRQRKKEFIKDRLKEDS